jgi:uncharacterized protein (TIGR00255 family)
MTGYGKSECMLDDAPCTVEARSVNGRYLELSVKLPKEYSEHEGRIREVVREQVLRGSVNLYIRREDLAEITPLNVDVEAARHYVDALRTIQSELGVGGEVRIEHLTVFPSIFQRPLRSAERPDVWPALKEAVVQALTAMNSMRDMEGKDLSRDLVTRCETIASALEIVEKRSLERIPAERERLRERVRQILDENAIDESRLSLEIVLLSEKLDITEECVRLRSHIKHFQQYMATEQQPGRKLNFLVQEMNREINTIGSKCNDADIAVTVVTMKEELERIREQIQNVE